MNFNLQNINFSPYNLPKELIENTEVALLIDDFEDTKTIQFINCGFGIKEYDFNSEKSTCFKLYKEKESPYHYLGISMVNHNGFIYLDVICRGGLNLALGDYFVILYEDSSKKKYTFIKPQRGDKYSKSNIIPLENEDLINFTTKKISKIKLTSLRQNLYDIYSLIPKDGETQSFHYQYQNKEAGQILFQYMTWLFIDFNLKNKII